MKHLVILVSALFCLYSFSSCTISKRLTYMQDFQVGESLEANPAPELKVQVGDRLDISVTCKNPQLALPFNVVGGLVNISLNGGDDTGSSMSSQTPKGYLVDNSGDIDFPVLGTLHLEGKTLSEVKGYISELLVEKNYIKDPIVTVNLLNFTITTLGELGYGIQRIEENGINLLDLLARTGGITSFSNISDLRVIRTENGKRTMYSVNLKSKDLYNSPVYNLQQNDIVYAMPMWNKFEGGYQTWLQPLYFAVSSISSISVIFIWLKSLAK